MANDTAKLMEKRVMALAEQFGRLVGTVERNAEGWLDPKTLKKQVTKIRDGATDLLNQLEDAVESGRAAVNPNAKRRTKKTPGER